MLESPFAGEVDRNLRYLRAAMRDSLRRGEAPFASHGLYTQPGVLNDLLEAERQMGILAGFTWRQAAARTVVYRDFGVTTGMRLGIHHAHELGQEVEYRTLGFGWEHR